MDVNYKKAFEGTRRRLQGYPSQSNLGVMYNHGKGVDVNYKKAIGGTRRRRSRDSQMLSLIWVPCTRWAMA